MVESFVERQARVNAACSSLIQIGFPSDLFTINNLYEHGYTEDDFLEFIKPISSIIDLDDLRYLFNATYQFTISKDFGQFIYNINWLLNDEEGKKVMEDLTTRILKKKLEKKKEMSEDDYDSHMQQYRRIQREIEIEEIKKRRMELETKHANMTAELKLKLGPLYGYEEPSINELRIEAYKLYEEDCRSKEITALPKIHELGFTKAVEAFGDIVKERHLLNYLNDPIRKDNIINFLRKKHTK